MVKARGCVKDVGDLYVCDCKCHENPNIMHCMPCCYECEFCGILIKTGCMGIHQKECKEAIKKLKEDKNGEK